MKRILLLLLVALALCVSPASAQDKVGTTGASFLTLPPSARHWGLDGAGAAVVDPFVMQLNPGGLGILALQSQVGAAGNSQDLGLGSGLGSYPKFRNAVIHFGLPAPGWRDVRWARIALAVAYHYKTIRYEDIVVTTPEHQSGTPGSTFRAVAKSHNLSLALGVEKGVEFGAGLTFNWIHDEYEEEQASGTARDFGVFVRAPMLQILAEAGVREEELRFGQVTPNLVFAASYCWANRGDGLVYGDDEFPLPRLTRFGWSAEVVLEYHQAEVLHFLITSDDEKQDSRTSEVRHKGCEFGVLGIVRYQRDGHWIFGDRETYGVSLHSAGVAQWISVRRQDAGEKPWPWVTENLDVFFRWATVSGDYGSAFGGTDFWEFGLTLNTGPLWNR